MPSLILIALLSFILSLAGTYLYWQLAIKKSILDIPNARSAHKTPTPRGGGVAFVAVYLLLISVYFILEDKLSEFVSMVLPSLIVAVTGFIDDRLSLSAKKRFLAQGLAAVIALVGIGGMPDVLGFPDMLVFKIILNVLAWFFLVWLTNLYNFMDGIDGLAAGEAIVCCFGMGLIYTTLQYTSEMVPLMILGAGVLAFLCFNFPPAKIFMGDVGSGFLGMTFGIFAIRAAGAHPILFYAWLLVLGIFIFDTTYTLLKRFLKGENITEAHNTHLYQQAARYFNSHLVVTGGVVMLQLAVVISMVCLLNLLI